MRNYDGVFEWMPSLIGTISVGKTAVGAPVKVTGFQDVLALLVAGASFGTGGNTGVLSVSIEESAIALGTGAQWTTISTLTFDDVTLSDGTNPIMYMGKQYAQLNDSNRKMFIRAKASMAGTDSVNPKFSVGFLLGRPIDTLYIANPTSQATGNTQFTLSR